MLAEDPAVPANIQVVVRARPLSETELANNQHSAVVVDVDHGTIEVKGSAYHNKSRSFKFHKVFDVGTKQHDIFETSVSPMLDDVALGYNVCIFAYGQTGSGKTYTMEGTQQAIDRKTMCSGSSESSQRTSKCGPGTGSIGSSGEKLLKIPESVAGTRRKRQSQSASLRTGGFSPLPSDNIGIRKHFSDSQLQIRRHGDAGSCRSSESESSCRTSSLFRMMPDSPEDGASKGIVQRSIHALFENLEQRHPDNFEVTCSHLELYNEEMHDLMASVEEFNDNKVGHSARSCSPGLSSFSGMPSAQAPRRMFSRSDLEVQEDGPPKRNAPGQGHLRLEEDSNGHVRCAGLSEHHVPDSTTAINLIRCSTQARTTRATWSNDRSSRSHSIVLLNAVVRERTDESGIEVERVGQLSLVDLAGSECIKRSGAQGASAREAATINQSLLTLGRVITALVTKQPHVPYRGSKLTRLLQDTLGGNSKTLIVANISPSSASCEETLSTLQYAAQAACIVNVPRQTERTSANEQIKRLTDENERLLGLITAAQENNGVMPGNSIIDLQNEIWTLKRNLRMAEEQVESAEGCKLPVAHVGTQCAAFTQRNSQDELLQAKCLEEICQLKNDCAVCESECNSLSTELTQSHEADLRLRQVMLDVFGHVLDGGEPPNYGNSTAVAVARKIRAQVSAQTQETENLRTELSKLEISQAQALQQLRDEEHEQCNRHFLEAAQRSSEVEEILACQRNGFANQAEAQAIDRAKLKREHDAFASKIAKLQAFDAKLLDEMLGRHGEILHSQGYITTSGQPGGGTWHPPRCHCEPNRSDTRKGISMKPATYDPQCNSRLAEAKSTVHELRSLLDKSSAESQRLHVELSRAEASVVARNNSVQIRQKKQQQQQQGECDAFVVKSDLTRAAHIDPRKQVYDGFRALLWSEQCGADAAAGPSGPVAGTADWLSSRVAAVTAATQSLHARLNTRTEETSRLCSTLADLEVTIATESASAKQELHETREVLEVERSQLSAQLTRAQKDGSGLKRQVELLRTELSTQMQGANLDIARHRSELLDALGREELAVDARAQAISVAEQSLSALTKQKWSQGRTSKELKRAVSVAAKDFSQRFTLYAPVR